MRLFSIALGLMLFSFTAHAERILIVGDSLSCGPFGGELVQHLTEAGHQVTLFCSVSSAPKDWMDGKNVRVQQGSPEVWPCQTRRSGSDKLGDCDGSTKMPKFSEILAHHPSDRVMVALGTNSLPDGPDRSYSKMLSAIEASERTCDWIGPPHLQPQKGYDTTRGSVQKKTRVKDRMTAQDKSLNSFYDSLSTKLSAVKKKGCELLDSRDATAQGTPGNETNEGLHSTTKAAKYRYEQMAPAIMRAVSGASLQPRTSAPSRGAR